MEVVKEALSTLLECLETTERESWEEEEDAVNNNCGVTSASSSEDNEMSKFVSCTIAFLLQHRPNSGNNYSALAGDANAAYGRCLSV